MSIPNVKAFPETRASLKGGGFPKGRRFPQREEVSLKGGGFSKARASLKGGGFPKEGFF
jgi:hypothetical protein